MASVKQVSPVNLGSQQFRNEKAQPLKKNLVQLNASSPNLLANFLDLMAHNNKSVISFGYAPAKHGTQDKQFVPYIPMSETLVKPYGQDFDVNTFAPTLSDYAKSKIYNEASSRINAERKWPQMDYINAWMVTAETDEFKSDGGLGKVAADLPNSFNKKFNHDEKNYMSVVTPMYVNGNEYKLDYDEATDSYIFFALTYNVTDDVTFVLPTTGSNNLAVMAMGGIGMLIVLAGGWLVYRRKRGYKGIINL